MKLRAFRALLVLPVLAAGLAALPTAAPADAAPSKTLPRPVSDSARGAVAPVSNVTVPGSTGSAARAAAGEAADHFKDLTLARAGRAKTATDGEVSALELHEGWGQAIPASGGSGIQATHSVVPNAAATKNDYLYAPTALAAGKTCMEITTAYTPGGSQVWAWDWCGGRSTVGKSTPLNSSFINTYTTIVNGKPAYTVDVHQTNASTNEWTSYFYNYSTGAWDKFYTSAGSWDLGDLCCGWDLFEFYSTVDPSTGVGYYCSQFNNQSFEVSGAKILSGGNWVPVTTSNSYWYSNPPPSGSSLQCPQLKLSITHANDGWIGVIGNGGSTTTTTTTRPSTTTTSRSTSTTTTSLATTTSTTTRTTTTTTQGTTSGACSAGYKTVGSWGGGFQGEVTVTAGSAAISGWTVTVTWPSGQSISQLWGGVLSGNQVTNAAWNGSLAAGGSTQFGFIGSGNAAAPSLSCTRS